MNHSRQKRRRRRQALMFRIRAWWNNQLARIRKH